MTKSRRGWIIGFIVLVIVVVLVLLWRQGASLGPTSSELPLDLRRVIPADWQVLTDERRECDFDGDGESEWLIVFRYDQTSIQRPYRQQGTTYEPSPIGAVIYDAQPDPSPETGDGLGGYQATFLVPYRLLPDFNAGKGQGYLGESAVEVILYPITPAGERCVAEEIAFLGYSGDGLPTRLSVFRWQDRVNGYRVQHFAGSARVAADLAPDRSQPITTVETYNRLLNHRSLLCEARSYQRTGETEDFHFEEDRNAFTLDFCFQAPDDPMYPEAVVVAQLRGNAPPSVGEGTPAPPGTGFFTGNASLPFGVDLGAGAPVPILSITNQAGVTLDPEGGHACTSAELGGTSGRWWCGRESAEVETEIALPYEVRRAVWHLISVVPQEVNASVRWRIERVELR